MEKPRIVRRFRRGLSGFQTHRFVTREERHRIRDIKRDTSVFLEHGLEGLRLVSEAFGKHGIPWYLAYGTLLGWRRENALIPHDLDIVIGHDAREEDVREALASAGFRILDRVKYWGRTTNENYWGHQTFVDLFYLRRKAGASYVYSRWDECCVLLSEPAVTPVRARFGDAGIWVPDDVDSYLEIQYGPGWRTPDPDWNWLSAPNLHAVRGNPWQRARCLREIHELRQARMAGTAEVRRDQ